MTGLSAQLLDDEWGTKNETVEVMPLTTPAQELFMRGDLSAETLIHSGSTESQLGKRGHLEISMPDYNNARRIYVMGGLAALHLCAIVVFANTAASSLAFAGYIISTVSLVVTTLLFSLHRTTGTAEMESHRRFRRTGS